MSQSNIIEVKQFTKKLGSFQLKDINFSMKPGYIMGLVGCNGAGKTTLLNSILGIYEPDQGEILINGYNRSFQMKLAKAQMAFITENCFFPKALTPKEIGYTFGTYYEGFSMEKFEQLCKELQVPFKKKLSKMSTGMVIKFQMAFALSYDASLYILDEPTAGLDPIFRKEFLGYLFKLVETGEKSIILSTQLTKDLDKIADYILFLEKGEQKFFMTKEELVDKYQLIKGSKNQVNYYRKRVVAKKEMELYTQALVYNTNEDFPVTVTVEKPRIEDIMIFYMENKK